MTTSTPVLGRPTRPSARARTTPTGLGAWRRPSPGPTQTGVSALIPYVVAGYPDAETSLRIALAAADAGADLLEVGVAVLGPARGRCHAAAGVGDGARGRRDARGVTAAHRADRRRATGPAPGSDGVCEPGDRRRRRRRRRPTAGRRRCGRADRRRPHARRRGAIRGRGPRRGARGGLSRGPDHAAGSAGRDRGTERRVPLLRVAGRRDGARSSLPSSVGRLVRSVKAASPVPVAVGFGVSRPAHVRAIAKAGADGVIVASALVDALGPDGRDVEGLARLVGALRAATGSA